MSSRIEPTAFRKGSRIAAVAAAGGEASKTMRPVSTVANTWTVSGVAATAHEATSDQLDTSSLIDSTLADPGRSARFVLGAGIDPGVHTGHVITVRGRTVGGASRVKLSLFDGATEILPSTNTANLAGVPGNVTVTLTEPQAALISSYAALELVVVGSNPTADTNIQVFEVDLTVP